MPTYQYACTNDECGLRFERVQAFTDEAITSCPDCADRVRKVYGSVGVVFKGSGFYRNDSRQGAGKGADSGGSGSSESSESSSSKPASGDGGKADKAKSDPSSAPGAPAKSSSSETKSSAPVAS